jgi:hypothetical protein
MFETTHVLRFPGVDGHYLISLGIYLAVRSDREIFALVFTQCLCQVDKCFPSQKNLDRVDVYPYYSLIKEIIRVLPC